MLLVRRPDSNIALTSLVYMSFSEYNIINTIINTITQHSHLNA